VLGIKIIASCESTRRVPLDPRPRFSAILAGPQRMRRRGKHPLSEARTLGARASGAKARTEVSRGGHPSSRNPGPTAGQGPHADILEEGPTTDGVS